MVPLHCYITSVPSPHLTPFHPPAAWQCGRHSALGKAARLLRHCSCMPGLRTCSARGLQVEGFLVRVPLPGHILLDTFPDPPPWIGCLSSAYHCCLILTLCCSFVPSLGASREQGPRALPVSGSTLPGTRAALNKG